MSSKIKNDKNEKKEDGVSLQIYGRVRRLMPWEPKKVSLAVIGNKIQNKTSKITNEYSFARVFKPQSENAEVFKTVVLPMISNVMKGYNAVLIAYGQTGSGKTYSMLGKPKLNVVGVLPMMLEHLAKQKSVSCVDLLAVEAFGHHVAKITLYDLFDPQNQTPNWGDKVGDTGLDMHNARSVRIEGAQDGHDKIVYAHDASHFAPTGKNPESSRGHVTFVARVTQPKSKHEDMISYFIMVDCAGSEGESAFTAEFKNRVDKETLIARRLEAGTINTGLSQLQVVFNQLRTKHQLTKTVGNGLRRVLHPYINTKTFLSVLFTISPSVNNAKPTESTLKFAVTAGMVKVKPIATKGNINFKTLVRELKEHEANQEQVIDENTDTIDELQRQIDRIQEAIARSKREVESQKTKNQNKKGKNSKQNGKGGTEDSKNDDTTNGGGGGDESGVDGIDEDSDYVSQMKQFGRDISTGGGIYGGRGAHKRRETVESNNEAMKAALDKYKALSVPGPEILKKSGGDKQNGGGSLRKSKSKLELLDEKLETQENDYHRLKGKQAEYDDKWEKTGDKDIDNDKLKEHALDEQIFLTEQETIKQGLKDAINIVTDYLIADGREAIVKFFRVKGVLPKPVPTESAA